jgi:hypothetical protein
MSVNACNKHGTDSIVHGGKTCPLCTALEIIRLRDLQIQGLRTRNGKLYDIINKQNVKLKNAGVIENA